MLNMYVCVLINKGYTKYHAVSCNIKYHFYALGSLLQNSMKLISYKLSREHSL